MDESGREVPGAGSGGITLTGITDMAGVPLRFVEVAFGTIGMTTAVAGVSLLITIGILADIPAAVRELAEAARAARPPARERSDPAR